MNDSRKKLTEEELNLIKEEESFLEEVNSDPEVAELTAPSELKEKIFAEIHAREAAKKEEELQAKKTAEEQELLRLGRIYKKRRKARKYWVLAAAVVCVLTFGITSMGGPERIYERVKSALAGREQTNVDSDEIEPIENASESEVIGKIEEKFGFFPVVLHYFPPKVEFLDAEVNESLQSAYLMYGQGDKVKITYMIRPNYRSSSWGADTEDELTDEFSEVNEHTTFYFKQYLVEGQEERWVIQFEYEDVSYFLRILDTSEQEARKIVENLYFY